MVGERNICGGGHLIAICFCCSLEKKCPFRTYALKLLGVDEEQYEEIKEEMKIEAPGTCFGNLAYCCSPEKQCQARDEALRELGWSYTDYLRYKWKITEALVGDKLDYAKRERVLKQYAIQLLELDTQKEYKAIGYGNVGMKAVWISEVVDSGELGDEELKRELGETVFLGARVPRFLVEKVDEAIERGLAKTRTEVVKQALALWIKAVFV